MRVRVRVRVRVGVSLLPAHLKGRLLCLLAAPRLVRGRGRARARVRIRGLELGFIAASSRLVRLRTPRCRLRLVRVGVRVRKVRVKG